MHRARKGGVITTSSFSKDAREFVSMIEKRIVLIDSHELAALMIGKVRTSIPRTKNENFSHLISMGYQ